ncbi:hypothetical protein [uncultured Bacteroides sp.]|uniref:hypothetical protein n=1 Tax=uncultured Bacteroides sp. TaxID=162156 RepID=UPI0025D7242E|nr:hypothetical protein [uncultured Bacteroides sp.]
MSNTPKSHILIVVVVCSVSSIFSLAAIIRTFSRDNLDIDYLGLIVGILSFLVAFVTIIFGYNMLDLKASLKKDFNAKLDAEISILKSDFESKLTTLSENISKSFYALSYCKSAGESFEKCYYLDCLDYAIKAIECENIILTRKYTDHCIYLIYSISKDNKLKDAQINIKLRNKYVEVLSMCNHKRINDIIDYILNLKVL